MVAATSRRKAELTLPSDNEILVTRDFEAPRHLVFKAWTTPELVKRWWTARRGEATVAEIDLRAGGRWRYAMVMPDGTEIAFRGEYKEVVPNERIVYTEVFEAVPEHEALGTVTFNDRGERTFVTMLMRHESKAVRDMVLATGMEGGLQDALDLLESQAQLLA